MRVNNGTILELINFFRTLTYRGVILEMDSPKRKWLRLFFCLLWTISVSIPLLFLPVFILKLSFPSVLLLLVGYPLVQKLVQRTKFLVYKWDMAIIYEYKSVYKEYVSQPWDSSMIFLKTIKCGLLDTYLDSMAINQKQFALAIEEMAKKYSETPYKLKTLKLTTIAITILLGGWFTGLVTGNVFLNNNLDNYKDVSAIMSLVVITVCFTEYNLVKLSKDIDVRRNKELRLFLTEYGYEKYGMSI